VFGLLVGLEKWVWRGHCYGNTEKRRGPDFFTMEVRASDLLYNPLAESLFHSASCGEGKKSLLGEALENLFDCQVLFGDHLDRSACHIRLLVQRQHHMQHALMECRRHPDRIDLHIQRVADPEGG
jgi:hypothetical protein